MATEHEHAATLALVRQRADAVELAVPVASAPDFPVQSTRLVRTLDAERTYVAPEDRSGGERHFCRQLLGYRVSGPVRLTELP